MVLDLYKPLGQSGRHRRKRPASPARGWRGSILGLACLVLAGSAASALYQPALRGEVPPAPPQALATPAPAMVAAVEPSLPAEAAPLPAVIRMNENGGISAAALGGFGDDNPTTGAIRVFEPGSLRQSPQLAHLPDRALLEPSAVGPLPVRAADGRRPLDVYAGASSGALGTRVAIVVGGLGISQTGTQAALEALPASVTLAFAAAGNSLERWMTAARRAGHELLLQAPMEPFGYPAVSPGEHTLLVADAASGDMEGVAWALGRLTNYVGVMNFMGARFSSETAAMEPLLSELGRRGLLYLDDGSSARSVARDVAMAGGTPFAGADRILDADRDPAAIRAELDTLERVARAQGSAIGVASAFDTSVATIAAWVQEAEGRGIEIVPVSALAFDPEAR